MVRLSRRRPQRWAVTAVFGIVLIAAALWSALNGRSTPPANQPNLVRSSSLATIQANQLPAEARQTLILIDQGGPFPYAKDGATFQNRERHLPAQPSGYYHEYTVVTPGSQDRGARRIIVGQAGERFYTDDHYDSFREIVP